MNENQRIPESSSASPKPPQPILQFFSHAHLSGPLAEVSKPFCELAHKVAAELPANAESSTALRKLLEAKDAAVRAVISKT